MTVKAAASTKTTEMKKSALRTDSIKVLRWDNLTLCTGEKDAE